jgi:Ca-activated chloride channel family protein
MERPTAGVFVARPRACARAILPAIKLARRIADNSFVQRSALIIGLTFALSAATLAGIGGWAEESGDAPGKGPSHATVAGGEYSGVHVAAVSPLPASILAKLGNVSYATSPAYTIRRVVPEVQLQFTVADEQGRLVRNLSAEDIRILDNQAPVERFSTFARNEELPLRLGIVLDTSDSVKRSLPEEKAAALNFLNRVMRESNDRAFVMAFGADIHIWQPSTSNHAQLVEAVEQGKEPGFGSRLFDALHIACEQASEQPDEDPVHRVLIVLSDGDDTQSFHELGDVIAAAQRNGIQIYALTLHPKRVHPRGDQVLQRLAEESGGRWFVAQSSKELDTTFATIEQELRTQYYVSFSPPQSTPGFHDLRIEVRAPQKVKVQARRGYYAFAP